MRSAALTLGPPGDEATRKPVAFQPLATVPWLPLQLLGTTLQSYRKPSCRAFWDQGWTDPSLQATEANSGALALQWTPEGQGVQRAIL
jgi:hypothetical protein